ncbi:class I SAM-dependent methyltransferase [Candidatus Micrarchaeota archaeon]|nr:class I SAM-dependent methyltransferase [Candidatus Micrarchaeota archaeon]
MINMRKTRANHNQKFVGKMNDWAKVALELDGEDLKQKIYDNKLFELLGELKGKEVLDYGCGPGVIANRAAKAGARIKAFDISKEMLGATATKIGFDNIYTANDQIPEARFGIVTCNLVVCIVPEQEVIRIMRNIQRSLAKEGTAYLGFCNPRLFDIPESLIDLRAATGKGYEENHRYTKTKKEGSYQIEELHRPIGWYNGALDAIGLVRKELHFTSEYETNQGRKISDFVIFELCRGEQS